MTIRPSDIPAIIPAPDFLPNSVSPPRRMMAAIRPIRLTPPPGRGGGTALGKYSARHHNKPVKFYCVAPGAASVCLVGDFNDWNFSAHAMRAQPDGTWIIQVELHHGHHRYLFLVDGQPTLDPRATGTTRNELGERVSLLCVS